MRTAGPLGRVIGVCLMLAACAGTTPPPVTAHETPRLQEDYLVTRDGLQLPLRHWDADMAHAKEGPRAIVVALHGMSDYSNAFDAPARQWAASGIVTLAIDQRGFGQGPNIGLWSGSDAMRADLGDAVLAAKARYPGVPVFALGESMGGAVLLTALAQPDPPPVAGAILVAPAVWSRRDMPLSYRVALFLAAHLTPGLVLSNSAGRQVVSIVPSDNVEMLRALGRDPLFQKRTRTDTLFGLVNLMDEARAAPEKLGATPPILLLTGKNDQLIPPAATEAVVKELGPRADVRRYDKGYHMLLRDLDGSIVNQDIADWILARAGAAPAQPK